MSDQPHQDTLQFLNAHIHILNHTAVKHSCRHIPPTAFLLQVIETLQDDTFSTGEPIFHIREIVMRVTVIHVQFSPTVLTYFLCPLSCTSSHQLYKSLHARQGI